jgi:hypothetical protein
MGRLHRGSKAQVAFAHGSEKFGKTGPRPGSITPSMGQRSYGEQKVCAQRTIIVGEKGLNDQNQTSPPSPGKNIPLTFPFMEPAKS